ncbi:MAG: polysaccharide deacetylase family protein [Bacteroidia bacterium]
MKARPPFLLRTAFPGSIWRMPQGKNQLYLTFDDGPHEDVTAFVADQLAKYDAKATFFCIGKNAKAHPEWLLKLRSAGHSLGNHTFNHENGWKTKRSTYLESVSDCHSLINSPLFRPPYGRITPLQFISLRNRYRTIFWDVLAADYEKSLSADDCVKRVLQATRDGSIITMHDSEKAWPRLKLALPIILNTLTSKGYSFKAIPESYII